MLERVEQQVVESLIGELGKSFDLSTRLGSRTLAEMMEERIRSLRPAGSPEWGSAGSLMQVAKHESGALDFYYRPHLFPGMDPALRLGHLLQFDLLPRRLPAGSPVRIAAVLESYCHLSGDLLGWRMEEKDLFLWIADVSGHGVRAGLAAAVLYFLIDEIGAHRQPAEIVRLINDSILEARNAGDERALFATGVWLRFSADGRGVYASSGHPPGQLRRASGDIEELGPTGMPVGLIPGQDFGQVEFRLEPGDRLCLYTDGLLEARDGQENEFGRSRLAEVLGSCSGSALEATRSIYRAIRRHQDTDLLEDDLTFLVVERQEVSAGD